ncbi:hypothetical protein J1N35_032794 [Gossypium stocksii]|uniref:Transmembrane 9 superfamily member n=1 Tax=Gossypium stocksii TaxID=47602 RepID=A0A9D3ZWH0_9ROSI|nr:hypothetical protein J1N35_032794 [Gossypium stocksii]
MAITFLAGIVLVIFLRTVTRDLTRYEELDKEAQAQMTELSGWKLVVGDVFRAPSNPALLCIMVGDGVQILGMAVVTILFAALGFMSPASRGTLLQGMGFRRLEGCVFLPWNCLFDTDHFKSPVAGKSQHRSHSVFSLCYSTSALVLHRSSTHPIYLVLTCMHLCVEDWKWWWKSFFASGSVAIYILYSINYLVFDLKSLSRPVSATLYLGYSLFMVLAIMFATGIVGFLSSFWFVHYLFSSVKLD